MSKYIFELSEKIDKKNREYDSLCLLLNKNNDNIKNKFLKILEEYDMDEADYNNLCSSYKNNPAIISKSNNETVHIIGKIYKNLISKSHPDRHINAYINNVDYNADINNVDYNADDFVNITKAYENMDMKKMLDYASKYNCDIDYEDILLMLEKQYYSIKNNVKKIRSYTSYNILINGDDKSFRDFIMLHRENEKLEKENKELKEKYDRLKEMNDKQEKYIEQYKKK